MNIPQFEKELSLETMRSERLRATLLGLSFSIVGALFLAAFMFDNSDFFRLLRERGLGKWIALLLAGMVLYQLLLRTVLGRVIQRGRRVPELLRYWNAFLETSIPSAGIIFFAETVDPVYALISIVPSFYFIVIILSTLRIDARLGIFTGVIAGLEFGCISAWYSPSFDDQNLNPMLRSQMVYFARAALMMVAGVAAGFVAMHVRSSSSIHCERWRSGMKSCACSDSRCRPR
jgi:adenylate cyclase